MKKIKFNRRNRIEISILTNTVSEYLYLRGFSDEIFPRYFAEEYRKSVNIPKSIYQIGAIITINEPRHMECDIFDENRIKIGEVSLICQ